MYVEFEFDLNYNVYDWLD